MSNKEFRTAEVKKNFEIRHSLFDILRFVFEKFPKSTILPPYVSRPDLQVSEDSEDGVQLDNYLVGRLFSSSLPS